MRKSTPQKPKRRTQDERRRATQEAILKAAIALLVEEGYAKFSTIAVAKRAGVSRGARENYYRTKYDLIAAAWRAALIRAKEHAQKLAQRTNAADPLDRFLRDSQSFFLSHDYMAMLELSVAARTEPAMSRIFHRLYKEHRQSHDDIWINTLTAAGYDPARIASFIDMTNYLLRGLALTSVWQKNRRFTRDALAEWRRAAPAYLGAKANAGQK
jgi:AcrR family transcriptional regulator